LVTGIKEYAAKTLAHIPELDPDIEAIKLSVRIGHVYRVIVVPPGIAAAEVVQYIASQSAKRLKAKFPFLHKIYAGREGIWSRGCCASCVGLNEKIPPMFPVKKRKTKGNGARTHQGQTSDPVIEHTTPHREVMAGTETCPLGCWFFTAEAAPLARRLMTARA
jgi:hypothetical protein